MDFDSTAKAQLDAEIIKPRWYAWLDIIGDPVRATTAPANVLFPNTVTDPDLKGQLFVAYRPEVVNISEVKHQKGGAGQVVASLSGLILPDNQLLNLLANPVNWQGRIARLWMGIHDQTGVQKGAVVAYYGGFMSSLEIHGQPDSQTIECTIESFPASWSRASGRTYMSQSKYDPNDLSAAAALAAANGGTSGLSGGIAATPDAGGGGLLGGTIRSL